MKTDDLIKALAADNGRRPVDPDRLLVAATAAAVLFASALFLAALGPRPDVALALETVRFDLKLVAAGLLGITALVVVRGAARPEADRRRAWVLAMAPALMAAGVVAELLVLPPDAWPVATIGSNALVCLTFIPLLGIAPLALFLAFLRGGAPVRPGLAGALAGIAAGGIAAFLYALHCTDDSPLFVALWYSLAIAILAAAGALAGRALLRW